MTAVHQPPLIDSHRSSPVVCYESTEKSQHLKYLLEFRTQPCPLFREHRCPHHRPFTCFYWHFPNQMRRRPELLPNGAFNYNPDIYCQKYDDTTGYCPEGDKCVSCHRNAGDSERRYHPRYYKTSLCVFDSFDGGLSPTVPTTVIDGNASASSLSPSFPAAPMQELCSKNGQHCAFAHGADDVRRAVLDPHLHQHSIIVERERLMLEAPEWTDLLHVLLHYKTQPCPRPPRSCRQGYACPYYHNCKDVRRDWLGGQYSSIACPHVKQGSNWLDASLCDNGVDCQYCHTRTEQQFHPQVYKSTQCKDMQRTGTCPRGSFCAFLHNSAEEKLGQDFMQSKGAILSVLNNSLLTQILMQNHSLPMQKRSEWDSSQSLQQDGIASSYESAAFDMQTFLDHALDDDSADLPLNLDILNNLPEKDPWHQWLWMRETPPRDTGYCSPAVSNSLPDPTLRDTCSPLNGDELTLTTTMTSCQYQGSCAPSILQWEDDMWEYRCGSALTTPQPLSNSNNMFNFWSNTQPLRS